MLSGPVTVTVGALSTMLRAQGIGELPVAIRPGAVWRDPDGEREAEAAALAEFREIRWVDRGSRLDGDALDSLHVLARPGVEYTAILVHAERQDAVVVAGRGDEAVIAYREGDAVTLSCLRHQSLPETLLRQIPDARPAPIDALNARVADMDARNGEADPVGDARMLARLGRRRLVGQGELSVATRDHYGRRQVSGPIRYQDYKFGRVVIVVSGGYVSVAPATKTLLLARLREAHRALIE
ncbi:MAG TPA: ESX secretion-associated protein EspG [Pseudonocardiaceae bacterium]|nr:ESX secretion-associated protein EspG [Pseudonocardiaceae bacterium]